MSYRFIHAADIHLDSPLRSLALRNSDLADLIGNATRRAFETIIELCLTEKVDALLIAGDLYDGDQTSMKTARFLAEQLRRLDQADIDVFIIRGNHDALSKITKELVLPARVRLFDRKLRSIEVARPEHAMPVVVHGLSFAKPQAPESLLPDYPQPVSGAINIGLMHTSLNGASGHDPYAPVSVHDLQAHGFDYWALGHIHKRALYPATTALNSTVVMAGNPQGRDINEAGEKSVTLVEIDAQGMVQTRPLLTSLAQFERIYVDAGGLDDWADLVEAINTALSEQRAKTMSSHLVARLHIIGETRLAWQIRRDQELLLAQAQDLAAQAGQCWIEKLEIECTGLRPQPDGARQTSHDPLQELGRLIHETLLPSQSFQQEMQEILENFIRKLPPDSRAQFGSDEQQALQLTEALLRQGSEDVLAQLSATLHSEEQR